MSRELRRDCPDCETERAFYLAAATSLHLGRKKKWHCPECEYGFVRIDGAVDTGANA
jgi:rubredoxin